MESLHRNSSFPSPLRPADRVAAMARAVQANLFQLKVADARRRGIDVAGHRIGVTSPGPITAYREALLDRLGIHNHSEAELLLRLHETWGQHCLMQWFLNLKGEASPATASQARCASAVAVKHAEIHATLWRLRFEQSRRHDAEFARSPRFPSDLALAQRIPVPVFGKEIEACTDDELLVAACEHAGMLATVRWILDAGLTWGQPGIMDVGDRPFVE